MIKLSDARSRSGSQRAAERQRPLSSRDRPSFTAVATAGCARQIAFQSIDAKYVGTWELPAIGAVTAPTAVLIRPDGYVAWVGDRTQLGLANALTAWFGPPTAA